MTKQDLSSLVAEILKEMNPPIPSHCVGDGAHDVPPSGRPVANPYSPIVGRGLAPADTDDAIGDITALDLRNLYLTENPKNKEDFARLKSRTPARLASGKAGPRYKTLTMLRFRADHAAAQDAVFSEVPESFPKENDLIPVQTQCESKEEYLTRPDKGRTFGDAHAKVLKETLTPNAQVQIVIGDGLSSAACVANAMDCMAAIRDGLKAKGISLGATPFVRYCRVGAGDAIGDITGCELVCMLVGERPGLVTDKSMSAYITYRPHTGVSESSRTVVSNIHAQGTPPVEAGAHIASLIDTILKKKVSGVGLHLEAGA